MVRIKGQSKHAAIFLCLPLRGCTGGQFEPTILTVSGQKKNPNAARLWNWKIDKNRVTTTHSLRSGNTHIGINSGARGEVKPHIVTVNAV
jgi:hypothetical protein